MGEETTRALEARAAIQAGVPAPSSPAPEKRGTVTADDVRFMTRALELARSVPNASPNPKVGAVVVRDGAVIGEGFHLGAGHPHAEAAALEGLDASGATLYVTLEPCNHHGRTPPCAQAIVDAGIRRVVASIEDPDPRVSGAGFRHLTAHGVEVERGLLAVEARRVVAPFLNWCRDGRPLVTLKLALTLDGRLAAPDGSARWITGSETRQLAHRRRLEADAVMVGAGTVAADDPLLTARTAAASRQPLRVVVDSSGRTPASAAVFGPDAPTLVATTERAPDDARRAWTGAGAEVLVLPPGPGGVDLGALLDELGSWGLLDVYCEGGAMLASSLLADELVGLLEVNYGPKIVGAGGSQLEDVGVKSIDEARDFHLVEVRSSGDDVVAVYEKAGVA